MPDLFDELYGSEPAKPATKAKKKPSAWELFKATPVAQGLREAVMAPVQMGAQTKLGEYLLRSQGLDPQTAQFAANQAREELARQEGRADVASRELYGDATGYELSKGLAKAAPVAALTAGVGAAPATLGGVMGLGALEGAATGMLDPVTNPNDLRNFWGTKAKQAGLGAAGGAAGSAVGYGIGKSVERGAGILAGKMRPGLQEVEDLFQKWGVRSTAGDVTGNPLIRTAETATESVPLSGMPKFRSAQGKEALNAAETYRNRLVKDMESIPWDSADAIANQAASGNARAQNVLQQMVNAGDDWQRILQTSGNAKLVKNKAVADELYNEVGRIAGDAPVPLNKSMQALQDVKAELASAAIPDQATLKVVSELESRLANAAEAGVDVSYTGLGRLRSDLGNMVDDYYSGSNALVGGKGAAVLQKIKKAVESDMDTFAETNPGTRDAFKAANAHYKANVVPFKDATLAKALKDAPADTVYGKFIKASTTPMQAEKFFGALDSKGQAAVRAGMVSEALEKATREVATEQGAVFSPAKFAKQLEDLKGARSVAFKGQEKFELDGLIKMLRHAERAGQFAENPPTGMRTIPFLLGGMYDPKTVLGVLASARGVKELVTSKAGKRLLLSASMQTPGTKAFNDVLKRGLPGISGAMAGDNPTPQTQPEPGGDLFDELYGGR